MVCVSYVPILTAGVMLCIVGDVQKFSMSFAKLDHGLCVVCPHTYGWCHVVYCGGCAEVQCVFCQTRPWFVYHMSPYLRLVSCCVFWGMCRSSLDHGLCIICPHTYGWCHVVYCGGCAEVQRVFCQTGPWFVCRMSPYLRLVSCCVLWGMCRSSVCLLPNWTMVCVSYVPILTAGVMLCIVGDVQKFTGPWSVCRMSPYLRLVSCYVLWGMCRSSVSFAKLDHGLCIMSPYLRLVSCCVLWGMCRSSVCLLPNWTMVCVICPHTYGWCHVVYCGGCAEVQYVFCQTGPWFVSYVSILTAGVMLCLVGDGQKFSVSFAKLDHGLCVICPHTYGWCHVVYCGGCAEVQCIFCQTGPWFVSFVPILTAGVMLCIVGEVQKFTGPWFMCFISSYLLLVSYYALHFNTFVI